MPHNRIVTLDGALNFRDIGGYKNDKGQSVKWNKIYRSDSLSSLSYKDKIKLAKLHVIVDCDLRSSYEKNSSPDDLWSGVKYVDVPLYSNNVSEDKEKINFIASFTIFPTLKTILLVRFIRELCLILIVRMNSLRYLQTY